MIFGSIFCSSWFRFGTQVGTQEPLKTVPERLQDVPKTPRRQLKSQQEHPKSKFNRFLSIFAPNLDLLNPIFALQKTLRDMLRGGGFAALLRCGYPHRARRRPGCVSACGQNPVESFSILPRREPSSNDIVLPRGAAELRTGLRPWLFGR